MPAKLRSPERRMGVSSSLRLGVMLGVLVLGAARTRAQSCPPEAFALTVGTAMVPAAAAREMRAQLSAGLAQHDFTVCPVGVVGDASPHNEIRFASNGDKVVMIVRYGDKIRSRSMVLEQVDTVTMGLTLAVVAEELVFVVTGIVPEPPPPPQPTPVEPPPEPPPPPQPEPRLRFGVGVTGLMYERTRVGFGAGVLADWLVASPLRLGAALEARRIDSEETPYGRVRYTIADVQGTAKVRVLRASWLSVVPGVGIATALVFGRGIAGDRYESADAVRLAVIGRARLDFEAALGSSRTLVVSVAAGYPMRGVRGDVENGPSLGGLHAWEGSVGVALLWSRF